MRTIPEIPWPVSPPNPKVLIPTTLPLASNSGPPELPGLMLTSLKIASASTLLTRPMVMIVSVVRGLPIARTLSPTATAGASAASGAS